MMGFKKIYEGRVAHDSGFGISFEKNKIKYWDNEKYLHVPYESILEPYKIIINTYKLNKWENPTDRNISINEKKQIIGNIESSLQFLEIDHEFVNSKY